MEGSLFLCVLGFLELCVGLAELVDVQQQTDDKAIHPPASMDGFEPLRVLDGAVASFVELQTRQK